MRIRIRQNGPYVIEDADVEVVDWQGAPCVTERKPIALCRCGASSRKPFCDGSHARVGFDGGGSSGDRPAGVEPAGRPVDGRPDSDD